MFNDVDYVLSELQAYRFFATFLTFFLIFFQRKGISGSALPYRRSVPTVR